MERKSQQLKTLLFFLLLEVFNLFLGKCELGRTKPNTAVMTLQFSVVVFLIFIVANRAE